MVTLIEMTKGFLIRTNFSFSFGMLAGFFFVFFVKLVVGD